MGDLEQLQKNAAASGFIHDPAFYSGKAGKKCVLGAIFQTMSDTAQDAIIGGLTSFAQLVVSLLPEEDPYAELIHFSTYLVDVEDIYTDEGDLEPATTEEASNDPDIA